MPLPLLLLLVLLGPGSRLSLGLPDGQGDADEDDLGEYDDTYVTDPPEMLETIAGAGAPGPEHQATMGTLGQRGTPEPATLEATTGATPGKPSTELATSGVPVTPGPLTTELDTTTPPITEAPSTAGAPSTELAAAKALPTEPLTTQRIATEALTTESLTTQPTATEVLTMEPLTTQSTATEALTTEPLATQTTAMEALTTEPLTTQAAATEALTTEPATTAAPPTMPTTTETLSEEPATTAGLSTALLVPSDPHHGGATEAIGNSSDASFKRGKSSQGLPTPSPTRGPDYMPVKHCLLAILILALVATTFLVCTVVLAVRLSRRNHMYHVRSYSPTEMVCISSLLPEGGEAPAPTANGSLPAAKGPGLKEGPREDPSGDDLTLHSFLP
ncbi:unnamed protein product [Pipistrellus nathusii]|uniref:P-selectin glycoprotein ligand 1 n=1 Tax=Pipistrellus nathusii TaxID=59473 RepID=A0ABN9ZSZ0_PIPNA